MSIKVLFWSERDVSLGIVVLIAACAFAMSTFVLGAATTLDFDIAQLDTLTLLHLAKTRLRHALQTAVRWILA